MKKLYGESMLAGIPMAAAGRGYNFEIGEQGFCACANGAALLGAGIVTVEEARGIAQGDRHPILDSDSRDLWSTIGYTHELYVAAIKRWPMLGMRLEEATEPSAVMITVVLNDDLHIPRKDIAAFWIERGI